jgi:hypothetical protein
MLPDFSSISMEWRQAVGHRWLECFVREIADDLRARKREEEEEEEKENEDERTNENEV